MKEIYRNKYFNHEFLCTISINSLTLHRSSVVSSMTDLQTFSTFGTQTLSNTVFVVAEQSLKI